MIGNSILHPKLKLNYLICPLMLDAGHKVILTFGDVMFTIDAFKNGLGGAEQKIYVFSNCLFITLYWSKSNIQMAGKRLDRTEL